MEDVTLTPKQKAFVEGYAGNATEAAIKAGYSPKTARSQGQRLLTNVDIARAIKDREAARIGPLIASREERQAFWTRIMQDAGEETRDRLRASELLGKSNGDFLDRVELGGEGGGPVAFRWASE